MRALGRSQPAPGGAVRARQRRDRRRRRMPGRHRRRRRGGRSCAGAQERRVTRGRRGRKRRWSAESRTRWRKGSARFGPSAAAAELEGSKAFAKSWMSAAGVPSAWPTPFASREGAEHQVACASYPGGPEGGRPGRRQGRESSPGSRRRTPRRSGFFTGTASARRAAGWCSEEFLGGEELAAGALATGRTFRPMAPAQDYKRIFDGDEGPEHRRHGQLLAGAGLRRGRRARRAEQIHGPALGKDERGAACPSTASSTRA